MCAPSAVHSAGYATRPGTLIKTKGGVGLCFTLFGSSFLFITSHFTGAYTPHCLHEPVTVLHCSTLSLLAHDHRVTERNSDMQRIAANLALSDEAGDKGKSYIVTNIRLVIAVCGVVIIHSFAEGGVNAFDYVFWFGDFNYRVEMERTKVDKHLNDSDCRVGGVVQWSVVYDDTVHLSLLQSLLLHDQLTKEILQGESHLH